MSDEDAGSRTEEATETKLRETLERGNVPTSREVAACAALLAMLAGATLLLPRSTRPLMTALAGLLDRSGTLHLDTGPDSWAFGTAVAIVAATFLLPFLALLAGAGLLGSVVQTPLRVVGSRIAPQWSRVSPAKGLERLVGKRGAVEFAKSIGKVCGLGTIAALVLMADAPRLLDLLHGDPTALPGAALVMCVHILSATAAAMVVATVLDVLWSRRQWRTDLRMTRHEVKEEHKQAEGDPLVKARLRSIALDRARRRMMTNVPRATLIVTNPTHFAVALRYVRAEGGAPVVVAKGQDLLALRIRETARDHGIPIVENKPLARALYDQVAVDAMIPSAFYRAVAEILNMLERRRTGLSAP